MRAIHSAALIRHPSSARQLDIPFFVMGFSFIAMAALEYLFPDSSMGGRVAIKFLCGSQIAFAIICSLFSHPSLLFKRWPPISFLLLFLWMCLSGIIQTQNMKNTLQMWSMSLYWYSFFAFFYIRAQIKPERLQPFLILAVCSLLVWLPALKYSSFFIMKNRYEVSVQFLLQNYIGYYIVALFPYTLMLKKKSIKVITFAIIAYGTVYSLKRGAILALFLMGFISSFLYLKIVTGLKDKVKITTLLLLVWVLAITAGGLFALNNKAAIERRITTVTGRPEAYRLAFEAIGKAELYELIIGKGDRQMQASIHAYAHNDWLFILFDYGIIGVILMINVYLSIINFLWKLWQLRSELLLPLVSAFILMGCVQLYSMGLNLKTFGFISGSIGLTIGSFYAEARARYKVYRL